MPLTGGFVAKLAVFSAAVDVGQYVLALIGDARRRSIAAFVYLRIVLAMYAPADDEDAARRHRRVPRVDFRHRHRAHDRGGRGRSFLGIMPGGMLDFAQRRHPAPRGARSPSQPQS